MNRSRERRLRIRILVYFFLVLITIFLISGCFAHEEGEEAMVTEEDNRAPIKIYIGSDINSHTVGGRVYHFSNLIGDYLEQHLPEYNIFFAFEFTFPGSQIRREVFFDAWGESEDPEPDIIIDYAHQIPFFLEEDHLEFDMLDFSEIYDIDLDRFDSSFIEQMMAMGDGTLYALPFARSLHALKYNKAAFDEADLAYPEGEITWSDVQEWGEYLPEWTSTFYPRLLLQQLSTSYTEMMKEENREKWQEIFPLLQYYHPVSAVFHNRNYRAYRSDVLQFFNTNAGEYFLSGVEWDLAPYPIFPEQGRQGPDHVTDMIAVTPFTDNIEGAFEVVKLLLSDEFQIELTKLGHGSPLWSADVHQHFGTDVPYYEGKNTSAFFRNKPTGKGYIDEQELLVESILLPYLINITLGMEVEEELEKMIEEYKAFEVDK